MSYDSTDQGYVILEEEDQFLNSNNDRSRSRELSPSLSVNSGKRSSSAFSSDESSEQSDAQFDDTVKGSDEETEESFIKVVCKKNRSPPPRARPPPSLFLRDKAKWNAVLRECLRLHIQNTKAQNTVHGIKIKAAIKGVPIEIETDDIKFYLEQQGWSVHIVYRMHRRDGSAIGMVLAILDKFEMAKDTFRNLSKMCGLVGITMKAPYRRGKPRQCHRCQLYGHAAANCHAQPRCVKCKVPHWTKQSKRTKEARGEPPCCNCGRNHTANYGRCLAELKLRSTHIHENSKTNVINNKNSQPNVTRKITVTTAQGIKTSASGDDFHPAPLPSVKPYNRRKESQQAKEATRRGSFKPSNSLRSAGIAASALGEDISTIMFILQVVRSAEISELVAKFRKAKHGVDRLRIILHNQGLTNRNGREMEALVEDLHFNIVTPLTPTHYPNDVNRRPDILHIALMKGVALEVSFMEPLQYFNLDHRLVLMRLSCLIGDCLPSVKTITNWQKVSSVLEEIDTPILNSIPDDIVSTDHNDNAIGGLTSHIRTVLENS
ncbi:hypothetical protein EVAR_13374_1 [Eumeta japonica]|uniref:Nucleic-acid-binding protein from transposon X-element n=1 Tax=Eumeta variegata TaxID=151549 RepID=A0A4C1TRY8_EUMVA|nr:hypothetical protein EVAR_13374_1 [Eumeta japonica]